MYIFLCNKAQDTKPMRESDANEMLPLQGMRKILVIRFSSIGDIVLTSPVLRSLRSKYPVAEIHFLTKESMLSLLAHNPHLHKIYTIRKKVSEVLPELKAEGYDLVVDLHKNIRSTLVKMSLNTTSFSYHKLNYRKWMLVRLKVNLLPSVHIVDRYFDALESLDIRNDGKGLEIFIPAEAEQEAARILLTVEKPFVVFSIGAAHFTKRLPESKWKELASLVKGSIVIAGGKEEFAAGEAIKSIDPCRIVNASGKCSILVSAVLLRESQVVVSNDTGLMHIASCFAKPIVSVWGSTVPEFGMYPYLPQHPERSAIVQTGGLKCRPCSKIGFPSCPKEHFSCMESIPATNIYNAIRQLLS